MLHLLLELLYLNFYIINAETIDSWIPRDKPKPKIGDISGDISIAPMMTAVELVSKPIEAKTAAHNKSHIM